MLWPSSSTPVYTVMVVVDVAICMYETASAVRDFKDKKTRNKAARESLVALATLFIAILFGWGVYLDNLASKGVAKQLSQTSNDVVRIDPLNQRVATVIASGSLTVSGFDLHQFNTMYGHCLLDFHQRGPERYAFLFSLERSTVTVVSSNQCLMGFIPTRASGLSSRPAITVGDAVGSIDTCELLFAWVTNAPDFTTTGGGVTLTLNNTQKRFVFPPQRLPSTGSITVVGVPEGTNTPRVVWTYEPRVMGDPPKWKYRLE